ncbi:MAG: hypothetical protein ACJ72L_13940 [Marmoricola sp.]
MNTALAAMSVAFICGLAHRELVISSAAAQESDWATSRQMFVSGYYRIWCRASGTQRTIKVLGAGALIGIVLGYSPARPWVAIVSIAAILSVLGTSSRRTWPLATSLASDAPDAVEQTRRVRTLRRHYTIQVLLLILVLALQASRIDGGIGAAFLAANGSAFLAATMWNEVVVDAAVSRGQGKLASLDRAALLGYYQVMTQRGRALNLAAVFLGIGVTLGALVFEVHSGTVPAALAIPSLIFFCAFLVVSTARSWRIATRLGNGEYRDFQLSSVSWQLSRLHRFFVLTLIAVATLQVVATW